MRSLTHLERLEAESIHIFREVVAEAENPVMRSVRFRTRGCYPLTGATQSDAADMNTIIQEMLLATSSERQGRAIDKGQSASMEDKKQEGYF